MGEIKAIDTVYKGYKFRSRLEARWAVFFDAVGTKWRYEAEGYELDGVRYLPDFTLFSKEIGHYFIEIKPNYPTDQETTKAKLLAKNNDTVVFILSGDPYDCFVSSVKESKSISIDQNGNIIPVEGFFFMVCSGLLSPKKYITLVNNLRFGKKSNFRRYFETCKTEVYICAEAVKKARSARFEFGGN